MKSIGVLDIDSHNFPNLCLMKISAYHKAIGDRVEWWNGDAHYDKVYASKIFTPSPMPRIHNAYQVVIGGSGIDLNNKLPDEIEHQTPDYSLYPQYDFALGFLTRGCPCNHPFCITPEKDGYTSVKVADLQEFWTGQKTIVLLDQNLLACREHRLDLIAQLAKSGTTVEMNGGTDIRFMTDEVIEAFRRVHVKDFHFAWDDPRENLYPRFKALVDSGLKRPDQIGVYVLTNYWSTTDEDLYRVYALRSLNLMPYVMIYDKQNFVDARGRLLPSALQRYTPEQIKHFKVCQHMQRWANSRRIIKSCPDFNNYAPYQKWKEGCVDA